MIKARKTSGKNTKNVSDIPCSKKLIQASKRVKYTKNSKIKQKNHI